MDREGFVDLELVFEDKIIQRGLGISLFSHPQNEAGGLKTAMEMQGFPLKHLVGFIARVAASINGPESRIIIGVSLELLSLPVNRVNRFLVQFLPLVVFEKHRVGRGI